MTRKKIVIASQSHLSRNPRVLKEALTLSSSGYDVKVITSIYSKDLLEEDKELLKSSDVKYGFYCNLLDRGIKTLFQRAVFNLFRFLQQKFGIESRHSLGYAANNLKLMCRKENAHLYIMHQELATIIGNDLIKSNKNYIVAFDLEDYYSEDLLPSARKNRPITLLAKNESFALNNGAYVTTTSNALSQYLYNTYSGKKAYIIRNVFEFDSSVSIDSSEKIKLRLYWFSQTIGAGRGLELLVEALNLVEEGVEIHLRGNIDQLYQTILKNSLSSIHELYFHPLIANTYIVGDMSNYDIGLALEPNEPLNKYLTSSNKIFHYLTGGLPVIASNTLGQQEVRDLQNVDAIFLFDNNSAANLALVIDNIIQNKTKLPFYKENALKLAAFKFNWLLERKKLVQLVDRYV